MNNPFATHTHYVGLDWAKDHHDVVIVDRTGNIVADLTFKHDARVGERFGNGSKPIRRWAWRSKPIKGRR